MFRTLPALLTSCVLVSTGAGQEERERAFYLPENPRYTIADSVQDSLRFTLTKTLRRDERGHLVSISSFVDPEANVMGWHDFGNLEGPGWAANAVGGAWEIHEFGTFLDRPVWREQAVGILDHVLESGFLDPATGFIRGYRETTTNKLCLNYKHNSDWFCPGSMAKVAFQLLCFADRLGDDPRAKRMRETAVGCAAWIQQHVEPVPNGWFARRVTPAGKLYRKSPDGGDDPFWQTSADGLFIVQLEAALTERRLADYRGALRAQTAAFIRAGGIFGSINHDTYDPHENVAYSVAFRTLLLTARVLEDDALREFAYQKCLAGLEQFKMTDDRHGVATRGLLYMEKSWDTAYLWENAEAALAWFEAAADCRARDARQSRRYELDGLTVLRAAAKHHYGPHGFLTEGVDWNDHVGQQHHIGQAKYAAIRYTEPFLNNQHIAEPTLYYLQNLATKTRAGEATEYRDCEGTLLIRLPDKKPAQGTDSFPLEVVATTTTQIVVQWQGEPANTTAFWLQRATDAAFTQNVKTYSLDKGTRLFSDTDREPISKARFRADKRGPLLDPKTTYYYRVTADLAGGGTLQSTTVSARVSEPVRGKAGDLWADVVLGKPHFGENVPYQPTRLGLCFPGGVLIDHTVKPNRMYIADCNNNRVLGFKCTSPTAGADLVLGQPDFNSSGGNGDSCAQLFPYRGKASAGTLCLTLPTQISIGETVVRVNMTVDEKGNLYVPDIHNHRVLKFNDPFRTDAIADEVWGQADFTGNEPNRGAARAGSNTLQLSADRAGVALDAAGNLWVADSGNNRVLRFPKNAQTGVIAKDADLVLGQADFTTNGEHGYKRTLAQLWYPIDLEFDARGRLYVCDGISNNFAGRILVFDPPFQSGMPATRKMPMPSADIGLDADRKQAVTIGSMARDIHPDRIWFEKGTFTSELIDLNDGRSITSVHCDQSSGIDVDSDGNLYTVNKWAGVYRYPASSWPLPWTERRKLVENVMVKSNSPTAASTAGILGITTFKDQLLIAENSRVLIWNNFDVEKIKSGQPADDVYGEKDFVTIPFQGIYLSSPQVDQSGRLWLSKRGRGHELQAFAYPLTRTSEPRKTVPLLRGADDVLPVAGGGAMHAVWADFLDFAVVGSGDKIWVADRTASRVFRINNVDGVEDPQRGPYVDIVLGQNNLTDREVNQGRKSCGPRTLAWAYNVGIGPDGELLISDNGGECGSNQRILIYGPSRFPAKPDKCLLADDIGDPDRVIGAGGRLDGPGSATDDPICSPFQVGISARGTVVAGMNAYAGQRFPLVYLDPRKSTQPQLALGDMTAYPTTCFIDKDGNVYIGDYDWSRVLIYKKPFQNIRY